MADSLPILTFHAIEEQSSVISFPPELFRRGMAKLYENGYRALSLLEAIDYLRQRKPLPDRSFTVTFDDGYQTVYEKAFPVLQEYAMPATIFLSVGESGTGKPLERLPSLKGRSMLNWSEIQEMKRAGIEFGAHTLTHPNLTLLPLDRVKAEICDSKTIIESALGVTVASFAYPYGLYDHRVCEIVKQRFTCACSDKLGLISIDSDSYALERVDAYYLRTDKVFDLILTKAFPSYIQIRAIFRRIRRAIQPR